ncbi:hypothetical protein, partial [Staphylococcus epidermidis]|uniref:hypothetical protein n=1 Tax=Staphylococcus epidermidis TaxID=1282 RepID=UPI001C92CE5F
DHYLLNVQYGTHLYNQHTIHHIPQQLQIIIKHLISTQNLKIQHIHQNHHLLISFDKYLNHSSLHFPKNNSIHQLLHHLMKPKPHHLPLKINPQSMTYQQLDDYSNTI